MRRKRDGFTLIELVIALAVLVIGLVGIIAVIPLGQRASKDASVISNTAMLATEKIAEIKAYGYDNIASDPPPFALSGVKDDISWSVRISDVLASDFTQFVTLPVQHLKKIVVTAAYKIKNKTREDTYHSFVAQF